MRSTSFNLMLDWAQLGTHICSSESPINLTALRSVTSASFYLTEHKKILRNRKGMYVPVMFVLVPDKERKEGKAAGRRSAIYLPTAERSHKHYLLNI